MHDFLLHNSLRQLRETGIISQYLLFSYFFECGRTGLKISFDGIILLKNEKGG
jgi:hypothetical protein